MTSVQGALIDKVKAWLARDPDPATRDELQTLVTDRQYDALTERFHSRLAFGTAGLRAVVGAGPMRMNRLVVQETTAGLGCYVLEHIPHAAERGVVIAYDGRLGSSQFARDAACVLAGLGMRVHLLEHPAPTPLCAFAVTHVHAAAGVMITASHNPKEYNGYKVYWENGAQIIPPHDEAIVARIVQAATQSIPWCDEAQARRQGILVRMDDTVTEAYLRGVDALRVHAVDPAWQTFPIAYTPLHGVGAELAEIALRRGGLPNVHTVSAQRTPDGTFPTVVFPNPEEPGAMDYVIALARAQQAPIALANDPDADRLAVAVRTPTGDYRVLTGDEIGTLLAFDRITAALRNHPHPQSTCVGTTLVSSRLLRVMAEAHGIAYFETLTGFKWLANEAMARQAGPNQQVLLLAYEEALGYGVGDLVRDKDGISAAVAFAQMTAAAHARGQTMLNVLEHIYRTYGMYVTAQRSINLIGSTLSAAQITEQLRQQRPMQLAGFAVETMTDGLHRVCYRRDGQITAIPLPASDVLIFDLEGERRIVMRPSGTEPKFKCYYGLRAAVHADEFFENAEMRVKNALNALIAAHQQHMACTTPEALSGCTQN